MLVFFFFQAEDGIRDLTVTGVQTCALPISMIVSGVVVLPDTFASGTVSASALEFMVPAAVAARYSCRPIVPAPESLSKFTFPFTSTESTMDDPAPGKSMRRGVLDALSGGPGGTKYGVLSSPVPLMKLYTSTLKMACPSPHAAARPASTVIHSHFARIESLLIERERRRHRD